MNGKEYYKYNGEVYKLVDFAKHKDQESREWITTALYTNGKQMLTREVGEFYERFTQIRSDSIEVAAFNLKQKTKW